MSDKIQIFGWTWFLCRGRKNQKLHVEKQISFEALLPICACVCVCVFVPQVVVSVCVEWALHTAPRLSDCAERDLAFPLLQRESAVPSAGCVCQVLLQICPASSHLRSCCSALYFFFLYHICIGWFCFTLFIFVLQEFLLFNLSGKHSWSVLLKCSLNAFWTCQCILCTMNLVLHRTVKEICICDPPWCIELILNPAHNSHSVLFPDLLGDICILSDFIKSVSQHALVSHQSVAGMDDYTCTSGCWENKGVWSLVHRTD